MSGPTTSSRIEPMTEGATGCCACWTSSRASAWRSGSPGASARSTSSKCWPISASSTVSQIMSARIKSEVIAIAVRGGSPRSPPERLIERTGPGERHGELQREAARRVLNGEIFYSLARGPDMIEQWRRHYKRSGALRRGYRRRHHPSAVEPAPDSSPVARAALHAGNRALIELTPQTDPPSGPSISGRPQRRRTSETGAKDG